MKIGHKLSLGLVGLTLLIAAIGYVSLRTSQKTLEKAIGKNSADFAEQVLGSINRKIQRRIEDMQALSTNAVLQGLAARSNAEFEALPDPNTYMEQIDLDWTDKSSNVTPVMVQLNINNVTKRLQTLRNFYQDKYGYPIFSEIFLTNRFGANIAQTNKTTDYYQADESWWQIAAKDGLFTSDVEYDESSNTRAIAIAARIEDANGGFLGIIKGVLNIQETVNIIDEAKTAANYKTLQLHLINRDAKIIYSTKGYEFQRNAYNQLIPHFGYPGRAKHRDYILGREIGAKNLLFAHAHSKGCDDFKGLDWDLVVETDTAEIFAPIIHLRNVMLLIGLAIIGLAMAASAFTYNSIVVSIAELHKATVQIIAGNLDTHLKTNTKDEIGQLACSFQKMAHQLKKTIADLNNEVIERKNTEHQLRDNQRFLDDIFDSIQDGISVIDKDMNIIKVNTWMEKVHRNNMPLVGKKCFEAYHKRNSSCPDCPCVQTLKTGGQNTRVIHNPSCGIKAEWVEHSSFPLKDHDGNITGVIEYVTDVTERKKSEQSLLKSEQRFREVVENARECVWETDVNGLYTYASPVTKEILGYKPDELVGKKNYYDILHPEDVEKVKTAFAGVLTSKQPFQQLINRDIHKDGHVVWLSTSGVPIFDEQGKVVGYRGVDADITEERKVQALLSEKAEQIMQHHNTLLKLANMPEQDLNSLLRTITEQDAEVLNVGRVGIWFFNQDKTAIVCRDLFLKSDKTHQSGDCIATRDYPVYFKAMENSRIIAAGNARSDPRTCEFDEKYLAAKGITSMMDVPVRLHGQIVGIICHEHTGPAREWTSSEQDFAASAADMISLKLEAAERRKAERALERLNKDLEATIQELSRSNRQLQDFVHIAAHDLKTPVRGIGTLADWIITDYGQKLDAHGREQIRLLKARVMRIDKLIDGMLKFSKITRTREKERQVDLNALLSEIIGNTNVPDNIEIAVDSLPGITCEQELISQVFKNLLSNAVFFMDKPKGLIKVGCVEQGDYWKFYVSDNGPGIEQRHYERIFRIFQTLPKKDEPETAGIGLAIVKKIVELYSGRIWIESQPGAGSTFFFTLLTRQEEPKEEPKYANTQTHTAY